GLDLFDKGGAHNFPTICFFETGYDVFTLRQAARRAWRIGQKQLCKVVYLHYEDTMQAAAIRLMQKKMRASAALEGNFSGSGFAADGDDVDSVVMALARTLAGQLSKEAA